jgi:hypothetical protein
MNESIKFNDSTVITPLVDDMQIWLNKANLGVRGAENLVKSQADQMVVTFSADDGAAEDISDLLPLFESKTFGGEYPNGVPLTLAIIAETYRAWTASELRDVQDRLGWEIACHSWSHTDYTSLTEAQMVTDIEDCLEQYASDGLIVQSMYYPFGGYNDLTREVCSRYFRSAFTVGAGTSNDLEPELGETAIRQFAIARFPLDNKTLAEAKTQIDDLVARGHGWCNFYMHPLTITMSMAELGELIDYVKAQDIPMLNTANALSRMGNLICIGEEIDPLDIDGLDIPDGPFTLLSSKGELLHERKPLVCNVEGIEGRDVDSPNTDFRALSQTVIQYKSGEVAGWPTSSGTLTTTRSRDTEAMDVQRWDSPTADHTYKRNWATTVWSAWIRTDAGAAINAQTVRDATVRDVLDDITVWEDEKVTYTSYTGAQASTGSWPHGAGVLIVNRMSNRVNGYQWQEWQEYNATTRHRRMWLNTGSWAVSWTQVDA